VKIAVVGTGYVGLVSGACFAEIGHEVVCVDIDASKTARINRGESPISEDGLDELLTRNVRAGRLSATTNLESAMAGAAVSFIAVGTPFDGRTIDLQYVRQAARDIGTVLRGSTAYHVVCVKSTVVPGTTEDVVGPILEEQSGRTIGGDLGLAMNPEFLAEGTAVKDFMQPDRIVIGAVDERSAEVINQLYDRFKGTDVVVTRPATAEMIKYASNSFLATVISFANEIANLCTAVGGVDVVDVLSGVHLDRRLSPITPQGRIRPGLMSFLFPGTGFGGSCFPKDAKALISFGQQLGEPMRILSAVLETNRHQPGVTLDLVRAELGDVRGRRVAVLGLAFKPGTDDVRESPAEPIIRGLAADGALVVAHDPIAIEPMQRVLTDVPVEYCADLKQALAGVDAVILVTSWPEYAALPELLAGIDVPMIDGRRFLDPGSFTRYRAIGRRALDRPFPPLR
jgi:UDPglucose 6-dehydrogenase/GDP-mannose 6-dehydrogenase